MRPSPKLHLLIRQTSDIPLFSTTTICSGNTCLRHNARAQRRSFHDYFVTLLPSSSLHPDSRSSAGPSHKLPRNDSTPHKASQNGPSPAAFQHPGAASSSSPSSREMTTVRIPLKSAKHHFGASVSRGTRPYNEDTYQAGTIAVPAFAKKGPISLTGPRKGPNAEAQGAESETGDPQVFYFGVFDGHGGDKCSIWLRENLHKYLERACQEFKVSSSLRDGGLSPKIQDKVAGEKDGGQGEQQKRHPDELSREMVKEWRETVGGYFRRFKPEHLTESGGGQGKTLTSMTVNSSDRLEQSDSMSDAFNESSGDVHARIESAITYAFLRGDLDFSIRQAQEASQQEAEEDEDQGGLGRHLHHSQPPFLGGSTCSVALISTPTPMPFWNPSTPLSLMVAHVGDSRILLCSVATGGAIPLTQDHHPSAPVEAQRLRRFSGMVSTDSFGEERMSGLANTRAFGDARSKRIGVSAEPELKLLNIAASSQYSFLTLVSDGITASLSDQEIVDIIKEAKTPEQGAKNLVSFATDLGSAEKGSADNATALVVRLGGWERRTEGGGGGMNTKEQRKWRLENANDPRRGRT